MTLLDDVLNRRKIAKEAWTLHFETPVIWPASTIKIIPSGKAWEILSACIGHVSGGGASPSVFEVFNAIYGQGVGQHIFYYSVPAATADGLYNVQWTGNHPILIGDRDSFVFTGRGWIALEIRETLISP